MQPVTHLQSKSILNQETSYYYNNHKIQLSKSATITINSLNNDCTICMHSMNSALPLKKLSCFHIIHEQCYNQLVNSLTKQKCPLCIKNIDFNKVQKYKTITEVQDSLLMECKNEYCTLSGTKAEINNAFATCPYPLASFPHLNTTSFFNDNIAEIQYWLLKQITQKNHFPLEALIYTPKSEYFFPEDCPKQPSLLVKLASENNKIVHNIFKYSSEIATGKTCREAFKKLLLDIRTDLWVYFINKVYPNLFCKKTNVFIDKCDVTTNAIIFKIDRRQKVIPLDKIFDINTKEFNWDALKKYLGDKNYIRAFNNQFNCYQENNNTQNKTEIDDLPTGALYLDTIII